MTEEKGKEKIKDNRLQVGLPLFLTDSYCSVKYGEQDEAQYRIRKPYRYRS
jgi:hypothetical protein